MKLREFIPFVVGAGASPLVACAQQLLPVIGVVRIGKRGGGPHLENAFRRGLREVGYISVGMRRTTTNASRAQWPMAGPLVSIPCACLIRANDRNRFQAANHFDRRGERQLAHRWRTRIEQIGEGRDELGVSEGL